LQRRIAIRIQGILSDQWSKDAFYVPFGALVAWGLEVAGSLDFVAWKTGLPLLPTPFL